MSRVASAMHFERCTRVVIADGHVANRVRAVFVPGRVELLGKHTDYCGGRSVTCAIDRGFYVAFAPLDTPHLSVTAIDLGERRRFAFNEDIEPLAGTWANYPMSVARRLARNFGGPLKGASMAFTSTLPQAAGMSSSSALVVATFLVLDAINGLAARGRAAGVLNSPLDLAEYLGTLENGQSYRALAGDRGVGTFGGSEDHTAITLARAGRFGVYGYTPTRLEREVEMPANYVLAIASSGVIAEKTGAARDRYNRSAVLVSELVRLFNDHRQTPAASLAEITRRSGQAEDDLRKLVREHVADPMRAIALFRRLEHFEAESETIIPAAIDALANGDLARFGTEVDRSQQAAQALLQNQVPETQFLAAAARDAGAVAASSFGAGFGGSVWAMIDASNANEFLAGWKSLYESAFPTTAARSVFFATLPADGTNALSR